MSGRAPSDLGGVFAPPRSELPIDRKRVQRTAVFALLRLASLALSTAVFGVAATMINELTDPRQIGVAWLTGFVVWLPTTILQLRIRFFPSPPDPWLDDADGGHSEQDIRRLGRSELAEMVLGMLPPLALVVWFAREAHLSPQLQLLLWLIPGLFFLRTATAARRQLVRELLLALSAGRATEVLALLEPLAGRGRRWLGDLGPYLLSRARFLAGDRVGAVQAIGWIRDRVGYGADVLEAQVDIEVTGPDAVLALADRLAREDDAMGGFAPLLRALANLHRDRDDLVIADAEALSALPWNEARRLATLYLAAAWAGSDPQRAKRLLAEIPWPPIRLRAMAACWPPIERRLDPLLRQR